MNSTRKGYIFVSGNKIHNAGSRSWTLFKNLQTYVFDIDTKLWMAYIKNGILITEKCNHATLQKLIKSNDDPNVNLKIYVSTDITIDLLDPNQFYIQEVTLY